MRKKGNLEQYQLDVVGSIAKKLKYLRVQAGFSNYEDFAYDADIARAQYGKYENGANMMITSLVKILKYHKMSLAEFFALEIE